MPIRKRGGKWQATVWGDRVPVDGRVVRKSKSDSFVSKEDAKRWLRREEAQKDSGDLRQAYKKTVGEFLDGWLATMRASELSPRTVQDYERVLKAYIRPQLGALRLMALGTEDIDKALASLAVKGPTNRTANGVSKRTAQYARAVLHSALEQAVVYKYIGANPAHHARRPAGRGRAVEVAVLDVQEMRALFDDAEAREVARLAVRDAAIVKASASKRHKKKLPALGRTPLTAALWPVMAFTGLRPSEALALRWKDDVDLERAVLTVNHAVLHRRRGVFGDDGLQWYLHEPKTAKSRRTLPLMPDVVDALRRQKARQVRERALQLARGIRNVDHRFVFANVSGKPLREDVAYATLKRALAAAKVKQVRLHGLRHTAATVMRDAGVSLDTIKDILGHTSAKMAAHYAHLTAESHRAAMETTAAHFRSAGSRMEVAALEARS
jgi:integrase